MFYDIAIIIIIILPSVFTKCPYDDALSEMLTWTFVNSGAINNPTIVDNIKCQLDGEWNMMCDLSFLRPDVIQCNYIGNDTNRDDNPVEDELELWSCESVNKPFVHSTRMICIDQYSKQPPTYIMSGMRHYKHQSNSTACHVSISMSCYVTYDPIYSIFHMIGIVMACICCITMLCCAILCGWATHCLFLRGDKPSLSVVERNHIFKRDKHKK